MNENLSVLRFKKPTRFSSEALFTSLMRIGVVYSDALEITSGVISLLADSKYEEGADWIPTTSDIRVAVMRTFSTVGTSRDHGREQVSFWFAAYIRRYGNPVNDCIKVIDHDKFVDLNYEYIRETILPHLISRIIGVDRTENPVAKYAQGAFPSSTRDQMAKAVVAYTTELNLYSIRYKTLINLLQDLVLEPPHPWMVNNETIERITQYNIERGFAHYRDIQAGGRDFGFEYSAKECMQHMCAAILSKFGSFLGVDQRYGLFELRRVLGLRSKNPEMWASCRLNELFPEMCVCQVDPVMFMRQLDVAANLWHMAPGDKLKEKLGVCCGHIMKFSLLLLQDCIPSSQYDISNVRVQAAVVDGKS